jgi:hypothetical protein
MLTLIVLPKRRGVLMSTSCWMWLQLFLLLQDLLLQLLQLLQLDQHHLVGQVQ